MNAPACLTVAQLAARWACHRSHIARMVDRGKIRAFRVGTLIRIPISEVERIECQTSQDNHPSPSSDSDKAGQLSGETKPASAGVTSSTRPIGLGQRLKPAGDGKPGMVLPGRWVGQ